MKWIFITHVSRNAIHSDVKAIVILWHGSAVNKIKDFSSIKLML